MRNFILAIGMVFFLAACSDSNSDKNGNGQVGKSAGKGDGGTHSDVFAVSKATPVNTSSLWGIWESQPLFVSGINIKIRIQFKPDRVTAASQCVYPDGVTLYAQVNSVASFFDNMVTIYEDHEEIAAYEKSGKTYTCTASIESDTQQINIISGKIYGDDFVLTKVAN